MCGAIRIVHPQIASDARLAMRNPRWFSGFTGEVPQSSRENSAMLACDAKESHICWHRAMRNACDSDSGCGLAWDATCKCPRCQMASDVGRAVRAAKVWDCFCFDGLLFYVWCCKAVLVVAVVILVIAIDVALRNQWMLQYENIVYVVFICFLMLLGLGRTRKSCFGLLMICMCFLAASHIWKHDPKKRILLQSDPAHIARYCDTSAVISISRDSFSGRLVLPKNGAWYLVPAHLRDTPFCSTYCDVCAIPYKTRTNRSVATLSLQRYAKYRCWVSKPCLWGETPSTKAGCEHSSAGPWKELNIRN